jgi:hypothetical protein
MSASSDRIERRWLRRALRNARCAACEGRVDEHAHCAVYIAPNGDVHRHLICFTCWSGDHAEVAARVQLNLRPTRGRA